MRFLGVLVVFLFACSSKHGSGFSDAGDDGGSVDDDGGGIIIDPDSGPMGCEFNDSVDHDGDGFSGSDGDCNDCDVNINPGAFDVPKSNVDEDCSGTPDDELVSCDATLKI